MKKNYAALLKLDIFLSLSTNERLLEIQIMSTFFLKLKDSIPVKIDYN